VVESASHSPPQRPPLIFIWAIQPGTDLALLYGLAHLCWARRPSITKFIDEAIDGFPAFRRRAEGVGRNKGLLAIL